MKLRTLKINDCRNSICPSTNLKDLDFNNWDFYETKGWFCLFVLSKDDETYHKVYCNNCRKPWIKVKNGKPYWVIIK